MGIAQLPLSEAHLSTSPQQVTAIADDMSAVAVLVMLAAIWPICLSVFGTVHQAKSYGAAKSIRPPV